MGLCGGGDEVPAKFNLEDDSRLDDCKFRETHGGVSRKSYPLGSESFNKKFPTGHHEVCLLI